MAASHRPSTGSGTCDRGLVTRPMRYRPPGFVPLPLPAVLGVAKDQPESPLDDPSLAEPSPRAPLPPLRQAHEEDRG